MVQELQAGVAGQALCVSQVQCQHGAGLFGHQTGHAGARGSGCFAVGISHFSAPFPRQTGLAYQTSHATVTYTRVDKAAARWGVGGRQLAHQLVAEKSRRHVAVPPNGDAPTGGSGQQRLSNNGFNRWVIRCAVCFTLQGLVDVFVVRYRGGFWGWCGRFRRCSAFTRTNQCYIAAARVGHLNGLRHQPPSHDLLRCPGHGGPPTQHQNEKTHVSTSNAPAMQMPRVYPSGHAHRCPQA